MKKLYCALLGAMVFLGSESKASTTMDVPLTTKEEGAYLEGLTKAGLSIVKRVPGGCFSCMLSAKKVATSVPAGAVFIAGQFQQADTVVQGMKPFVYGLVDIAVKALPEDPDVKQLKRFVDSAYSGWNKTSILISSGGKFAISLSAKTGDFDQHLDLISKMVEASGSSARSKFLAGYSGIFMPDAFMEDSGLLREKRIILYTLQFLGFFLMGTESVAASSIADGIVTLTKGPKTFALRQPVADKTPQQVNILISVDRFGQFLRELRTGIPFTLTQVVNASNVALPISPWLG